MATGSIPVTVDTIDDGVGLSTVGLHITAATAPSIGTNLCYVLADGASDNGAYCKFFVPEDYASGPTLKIRGLLDGAPGASDVLGFGVRELIAADNETGDGTFATEQTASATIGSSGSSHSDEDVCEEVITLTGTYAIGDDVFLYVYLDVSATTYAGNFLLFTDGVRFGYTTS